MEWRRSSSSREDRAGGRCVGLWVTWGGGWWRGLQLQCNEGVVVNVEAKTRPWKKLEAQVAAREQCGE